MYTPYHTLEDCLLPDNDTMLECFDEENEDFSLSESEFVHPDAFSDTPDNVSLWMEHASERFIAA